MITQDHLGNELAKTIILQSEHDTNSFLDTLQDTTPGSLRSEKDRAGSLVVQRASTSPSRVVRRNKRIEKGGKEGGNTFKESELIAKQVTAERVAFTDNWTRFNDARDKSGDQSDFRGAKLFVSRKVQDLRKATKNISSKKRPLPKYIKRRGDDSIYVGNRNRYHPHLDLIMAQAVLSPYNGDFKSSRFRNPSSTGWRGYTEKQLEVMEDVIESRLQRGHVREKGKIPIMSREKFHGAPGAVDDIFSGQITSAPATPHRNIDCSDEGEESNVTEPRNGNMEAIAGRSYKKDNSSDTQRNHSEKTDSDFFKRRQQFKNRLRERFAELCMFNSPFHRIQGLVNFDINKFLQKRKDEQKYSKPRQFWHWAIRKVIIRNAVEKSRTVWSEYVYPVIIFTRFYTYGQICAILCL